MRPIVLFALAMMTAAQENEVQVATTVAFTEGPTMAPDGSIYFTNLGRIMRLAPDGKLGTFREERTGANGLVFDSEGRLIACEGPGGGRRITRTDLRTGTVTVLADAYRGERLNGPNDVTLDSEGRIYFTDPAPGTGRDAVYRIDPDRSLTRILDGTQIEQPNGIMISPDDRTLYLVEANGMERGARMIRAYALQPDGSVRDMRVFHNFYPGRSADGLCIDTQGNLYAAAGLHRRRGTHETLDTKPGVHVFSPAGKLLRFIPIPEDTITNCTFGGADMKTLYVTAGKTLFRTTVAVTGTGR